MHSGGFGVALIAAMSCAAAGCGGSQTRAPTVPTEVQPSTISGTVVVRTAQGERRPAAYPLYAWVEAERAFRRNVPIDADGRYELAGLTPGSWVWLLMPGYWSRCAHAVIAVAGQRNFDIVLFDTFAVSSDPDPPGFRSISGVVYQQTASGRTPIAGAQVVYAVTWSAGTTFGSANVLWTRTDSDGRFRLCGLPQASAGDVIALDADEREVRRAVPPGSNTSIELEFPAMR